MGMLKQAFNSVTRLHSRAATLKRLGTPDIWSSIRITPSNYFRFIDGPSATVIRGREFLIPVDTMTGHRTQLITFEDPPTLGTFVVTYNSLDTDPLDSTTTAADLQTAIRALHVTLESVTVSGDFTVGFTVVFIGIQTPTAITLTPVVADEPDFGDVTIAESTPVAWSPIIKRADKIIDTTLGHMAVDEIIEVVDLGGDIMGYRIRCE